MKAIKQRFHHQIVKKHKHDYFLKIRKQIQELHQFHSFYHKIINNGQNLSLIIQRFGYVFFYKQIIHVLDEKLYRRLQEDDTYFLNNLYFINKLLQSQILPGEQTPMLITVLSRILQNNHHLTSQYLEQVFTITETILNNTLYLTYAIYPIINHQLISVLYQIIIQKEMNQYFFKIINFYKIIAKLNYISVNKNELMRCLQIHILTTDHVEELYVSYSLLGDFFHKNCTPEQELFQFGSVVDKTMRDIGIQRLVDPILFFLVKALNNHSLNKLMLEMNLIEVIFNVILRTLFIKNNVSVFANQSIWYIFRKVINNLIENNKFQIVLQLDWQSLRQKLQNPNLIRYPYIKIEIFQCLKILQKTCLKDLFADIVPLYANEATQFQI